MKGLTIFGLLCLCFLVLFFMFFMKRKWFNYVFKAILIGAAIYAVYLGIIIVDKYIREERTVYLSFEEVIEKNYSEGTVTIVRNGSYYYLIIEYGDEVSETEEELIRFENNKYTAFDTLAKLTKGMKRNEHFIYGNYILSSKRIEYDLGDEIVIIIKRNAGYDFLNIYDNYGVWDYTIVDNTYYYINVISEDDITDEYSVMASIHSETYILLKSSLYKDDYVWEKITE